MKIRNYCIQFWPIYLITIICFFAIVISADHAVATYSENIPIHRSRTIVIDAGHGGEDGGAISCTGIFESHINLEIAKRLNDLLNLLGFRTTMIRTTDISVYTEGNTLSKKKISDLKHRVNIVHDCDNPILISIHQNIFSDSKYSGAQVFFAPTDTSRDLAIRLQRDLISACNPGSNRKPKEADGIYLMQHITCPGILVECGFLSNPEEEFALRSKSYQARLCCVITSTLSNYLAETYNST